MLFGLLTARGKIVVKQETGLLYGMIAQLSSIAKCWNIFLQVHTGMFIMELEGFSWYLVFTLVFIGNAILGRTGFVHPKWTKLGTTQIDFLNNFIYQKS